MLVLVSYPAEPMKSPPPTNITPQDEPQPGAGSSPVSSDKKQLLRNQFYQYMHRRQLKKTKSRHLVLEYFLTLESGHHQTAESVYNSLADQGYKVGLATIYRTLNLMTAAKVLEQHSFQQNSTIYEINYPHMHHDHLICIDCGLIKEFEDHEIENRQLTISKALGFELEFHKLELFGKCLTPQCSHRTVS